MANFKAKARAVDLLGKGQIADLPTAISELWKNGYDAYGDRMECNLYLKDYKGIQSPIFTLSDDGVGMDKNDIETKWIVLGTDSKTRGVKKSEMGKKSRTPMGEKGIGRLSVSYLGNQMLMVTKKKDQDCIAVFLDWRALENYNLFLEEVNIPIIEFSPEQDFGPLFDQLVDEFRENLENPKWDEQISLKEQILLGLDGIPFPKFIDDDVLYNLLLPENHGTFFLIFDPHEQLLSLAEGPNIEIGENPTKDYLRQSLSGIYEGFNEEKDVKFCFWIHDSKGRYDLISKQNFFSESDMIRADHFLSGKFDKNGFFSGELRVFDKTLLHTFRSRRPPGETPYGPFSIRFGFMEGDRKNSPLSPEEFNYYKKKLELFGGLYIYRDGFRVLPYGRTEYDFLEFENRRTKSATYYQISHRRIFGAIELSRETNSQLKDKAGREGLISNKAYRQFVEDLKAFFVDLSVRYFRTVGKDDNTNPTLRQQQVEAIKKKNERLLKQEKKKGKVTRKQFKEDLENSIPIAEQLRDDLLLLGQELQSFQGTEVNYNEVESSLRELDGAKVSFKDLTLKKPQRVSLTKNLERQFIEYNEALQDLGELLQDCEDNAHSIQMSFSTENLKEEFDVKFDSYIKGLASTIRGYKKRFKSATDIFLSQIEEDVQIYQDKFSDSSIQVTPSGSDGKKEVEEKLRGLELVNQSVRDEILEKYDGFISHVENLTFGIDEDFLVFYYKDQFEKIQDRIESVEELAQLGMAIEIIDHQFNVLYAEMSTAVEFFKKFTRKNPDVEENYRMLREAFQHLETNHQLLTPLYRTTRRVKAEIRGSDIMKYLREFFSDKLRKYRVSLKSDKSFDNYSFFTFESVIKPVFINLVNNALYWLVPARERKIEIRYENGRILVLNSGEPIDHAYLEDVFALFFSRKPGGRGIGLYLARTNLRTIGFDIYATNEKSLNHLKGACFVIEPYEKSNNLS